MSQHPTAGGQCYLLATCAGAGIGVRAAARVPAVVAKIAGMTAARCLSIRVLASSSLRAGFCGSTAVLMCMQDAHRIPPRYRQRLNRYWTSPPAATIIRALNMLRGPA